MDEFAQTRQPDDLFDDDFVPIPTQDQPRPIHENPTAAIAAYQVGGDSVRGRRGRGGQSRRGPTRGSGRDGVVEQDSTTKIGTTSSQVNRPINKDDVHGEAVKGDRSGTGGVKMVRDYDFIPQWRYSALKYRMVVVTPS